MATRTVNPEIEHGAAGCRRGGLERSLFAASRGTLLAFPLQIEHRVVDADGEPDQQDDRADRVGHRQHLADERDESHGAEHRRQSKQEGNACGDERAEGDEEDDQRQRDREDPSLQQIVHERGLDFLVGALAERSDGEVRVCLLNRCDPIDDRIDLVGRVIREPLDLDRNEHGVLVVGDQAAVVLDVERRLDLRDLGNPLEAVDHRCDDRPEGR